MGDNIFKSAYDLEEGVEIVVKDLCAHDSPNGCVIADFAGHQFACAIVGSAIPEVCTRIDATVQSCELLIPSLSAVLESPSRARAWEGVVQSLRAVRENKHSLARLLASSKSNLEGMPLLAREAMRLLSKSSANLGLSLKGLATANAKLKPNCREDVIEEALDNIHERSSELVEIRENLWSIAQDNIGALIRSREAGFIASVTHPESSEMHKALCSKLSSESTIWQNK